MNGVTFVENGPKQSLLNPSEVSYVDHFWVSLIQEREKQRETEREREKGFILGLTLVSRRKVGVCSIEKLGMGVGTWVKRIFISYMYVG